MAHHHHHDHDHGHHHHHHTINVEEVNLAFIVGIILNFIFVIIEVVAGLHVHSLSLLSDAGHNLADVASLALSLFAFKMLKVKPTEHYTYGYKKTTVLVALFNAVLLLVSIGAIGYEAIHRLLNPMPLPGNTISIVAGIGIVINVLTALMFFKSKENDINVKSAYLHLMSDAIVSFGLVIGGIVIIFTHYYWIDTVLSMVIALVILISTWSLLRQSLRLSLDGVPDGISIEELGNMIKQKADVLDFHHIHVWAISTTQNALTGHLVVEEEISHNRIAELKREIKHDLDHLNIHHSTLEIEFMNHPCNEPDC